MNMMNRIMAVSGLLVLAACAQPYGGANTSKAVTPSKTQLTDAKDAILYNLKDPSSAKFRNIRGIQVKWEKNIEDRLWICGEVNARNSYGGYTGFTPFYYDNTARTAQLSSRAFVNNLCKPSP